MSQWWWRLALMVVFGGSMTALLSSQVLARSASISTLRKQARLLFQAGKKLALKKQYLNANQKFLQALEQLREAQAKAKRTWIKARLHRSVTAILFFIGRTYQLAKMNGLARRYFKQCLKERPPPKIELQTRRFMQQLPPPPKPLGRMVALRLDVLPKHASISLQNARGEGRFGRTPFIARVEAGAYQVEVTAAGFQTQKLTLQLAPGTRVNRIIRLVRRSKAIARVRPQARPKPTPPNPGALRAPLLWACVALAGTSVVIGGVLMAASGGVLSEATQMQQEQLGKPTAEQTRQFYDIVDNGGTLQGAGAAMFVVAGFAGGGALLLWLWKPPPAKPTPNAQTPPPPRGQTPAAHLGPHLSLH